MRDLREQIPRLQVQRAVGHGGIRDVPRNGHRVHLCHDARIGQVRLQAFLRGAGGCVRGGNDGEQTQLALRPLGVARQQEGQQQQQATVHTHPPDVNGATHGHRRVQVRVCVALQHQDALAHGQGGLQQGHVLPCRGPVTQGGVLVLPFPLPLHDLPRPPQHDHVGGQCPQPSRLQQRHQPILTVHRVHHLGETVHAGRQHGLLHDSFSGAQHDDLRVLQHQRVVTLGVCRHGCDLCGGRVLNAPCQETRCSAGGFALGHALLAKLVQQGAVLLSSAVEQGQQGALAHCRDDGEALALLQLPSHVQQARAGGHAICVGVRQHQQLRTPVLGVHGH